MTINAYLEAMQERFVTDPLVTHFQVLRERSTLMEVALYERFFARAHCIPLTAALVTHAYTEACTFGLSALDALHVTCAKAGNAEAFITTERPATPLFRVTGIAITPLMP